MEKNENSCIKLNYEMDNNIFPIKVVFFVQVIFPSLFLLCHLQKQLNTGQYN